MVPWLLFLLSLLVEVPKCCSRVGHRNLRWGRKTLHHHVVARAGPKDMKRQLMGREVCVCVSVKVPRRILQLKLNYENLCQARKVNSFVVVAKEGEGKTNTEKSFFNNF